MRASILGRVHLAFLPPPPLLLLLLLLLLLGKAASVTAPYWTITSYRVLQPTTSINIVNDLTSTLTSTDTLGVKPAATGIVADNAISTSIYMDTFDDVKIVIIYLPPSAVNKDDVVTTTTYENMLGPYTDYFEPIEYTAPSSCATAFTYATYTRVYIPVYVRPHITVSAVNTSYYTFFNGDVATHVTGYLASGVVPTITSRDPLHNYDYSHYITNCQTPPALLSADGGQDDEDNVDSDDGYNRSHSACSGYSWCSDSYQTWIVVIATVIPALFVLGFAESFFWFNRLMVGKFALRFGTIFWMILAVPILCFTRRTPSRDSQTQVTLKQQWKTMGIGKRLGLWFRWGFRHKYPVELLGRHPTYPTPAPDGLQQPPVSKISHGPSPPGSYIYCIPGPGGPVPEGVKPVVASVPPPPPPPPPEGYKLYDPSQFPGGIPPPGMVLYYPQQPPQALGQQHSLFPTHSSEIRGVEKGPASPRAPTSISPATTNVKPANPPCEMTDASGEEIGSPVGNLKAGCRKKKNSSINV